MVVRDRKGIARKAGEAHRVPEPEYRDCSGEAGSRAAGRQPAAAKAEGGLRRQRHALRGPIWRPLFELAKSEAFFARLPVRA
jgi:hypothetical protein